LNKFGKIGRRRGWGDLRDRGHTGGRGGGNRGR